MNMKNLLWKITFTSVVTLVWLIIIVLLLPLLPFFILVFIFKTIEESIYKVFYNSIHFQSEETVWLHDTPKNPTIINCLVVMEDVIDIEEVQSVLMRKLVQARNGNNHLQYPRATRYIHPGKLNYYWLEEENFQIEKHAYEWNKNIYQSKSEADDVISELATRPIITKENLSPWEYILIHYNESGKQRSIVFFRAHHSLADGISQVYFFINQLNDNAFPYDGSGYKLTAIEKLLIRCKGFFFIPYNLNKLFSPFNSKTSLDTSQVSGKKRLMYTTEPFSLELVKSIKNKLNVTVNDVMVGCLGTCLHNYFKKRGETPPENLTTSIPLDTRLGIEEAAEFSNKIAISQFQIPTVSADPIKNILETNKRMTKVKLSLEGFSMRYSMRLASYFSPGLLIKYVSSVIVKNVSMVVSNVPGPRQDVIIAGKKMKLMTFWPPAKDNITLSCSIFSYKDGIFIGIGSDEAVTKHPEHLIEDMSVMLTSLGNMANTEVLSDDLD